MPCEEETYNELQDGWSVWWLCGKDQKGKRHTWANKYHRQNPLHMTILALYRSCTMISSHIWLIWNTVQSALDPTHSLPACTTCINRDYIVLWRVYPCPLPDWCLGKIAAHVNQACRRMLSVTGGLRLIINLAQGSNTVCLFCLDIWLLNFWSEVKATKLSCREVHWPHNTLTTCIDHTIHTEYAHISNFDNQPFMEET